MIALAFLFLFDAAYHDSAASASTLEAFKIFTTAISWNYYYDNLVDAVF